MMLSDNISLLLVSTVLTFIPVLIGSQPTHICDGVKEELPRSRYATKTGYKYTEKDDFYWDQYEKETFGCGAIKVWFITRHGTRYPVKNDVANFRELPRISEEILYNHLQGRGCLNEEDVFEFKRWIQPYEARDKGQLHTTGYDELFDIGEHWRELFPNIFDKPFDSSEIKVEFTVRNRTGQSAYHFLRGMYGDDAIGKIKLPVPYSPNFLLRFYKSCPHWLKQVYRNNDTTYYEQNLFAKSAEYKGVIHAVSARLGYMHPLKEKDMVAMYDECRYETAWWPHKRIIWCTPFSKKDLEVLEYHQDLKYYYEDSYGTPVNKELACKTVGDLHTHLRNNVLSNDALPHGVLYFSHDKTIMKLLASIGLFKPSEHLRHDNFEQMKEREFTTSKLAPFASNLAFVLFRCGMDHKVSFFFQGSPQPMKNICPTLLCNWEQFEEFIKPISQNCDLPKTCMLHDEL